MEPNEFVQKLINHSTLDDLDWASDVERILAEQVVFLRDQLLEQRKSVVLSTHEVIGELYQRLDDKDEQITNLKDEVQFLRKHILITRS